MLRFLAKKPYIDFDIADTNLETPLFAAIKNGDLEMVKYLLEECHADLTH